MPANNWNNPQYSPQNAEMVKLESDSQLWLIVAVAGFFVGTMWVTGPLAWYQGNKLCEGYRRAGMPPSQNANAARIIGIITSVLSLVFLVFVCIVFGGFFAAFIAQHH